MAASTQVITDMGTVISNGPSATTSANAIAAAGPIEDYPGLCKLVRARFQEASVLLAKLIAVTDAGSDGANKTLLQNVQLTMS